MIGFEPLYTQTVTVFNRVKEPRSDNVLWLPTIIDCVHLMIDKSSSWSSQGERATDNARLHVQYTPSGGNAIVTCRGCSKTWYEPKAWRRLGDKSGAITFAYGDVETFDFFAEGALTEFSGPIQDSDYERKGFFNYMNAHYDNVFAITGVSKYNLIPKFGITAR